MFETIFESNALTFKEVFISLASALVFGAIYALLAVSFSKSSKSAALTYALIPAAVAMIIILVNGNLGVGVAVAGAFGLVRFRSAPGTSKEICAVFIAMTGGVAFGMGFVGYGALFLLVCGLILTACGKFSFFDKAENEKVLRITVPEILDYENAFTDVFEAYLSKYTLDQVKSTNMGSMFRLTYSVKIKENLSLKDFIDDLRTRNGNLEITLSSCEGNGDF